MLLPSNSTYLMDQLQNQGVAPPTNPRLGLPGASPAGAPGVVVYRPHGRGMLPPPNVSVQNQANPWGPFPRIYGTYRIWPVYGGLPFTEIVGNHQYVKALFILGYGPMNISNIYLGNKPLQGTAGAASRNPNLSFRDVELEIKQGFASDTPITLYPNSVIQDSNSIKLTDSWQVRETPQNADEIHVTFTWPNGLYRTIDNNGTKSDYGVTLNIQYQAVGDVSWTSLADVAVVGASSAVIHRGVRIKVPTGLYYIRVKRTLAQSTASNTSDEVQWSAVTAMRNIDPVPVLKDVNGATIGIAKIAIRMQVDGKTQNASMNDFNCVIQAMVPVWNGSIWTTQATNNPAWALADVLSGQGNKRAVSQSRLDTAALLTWANDCDANGFQLNCALDTQRPVTQVVKDITSAGRASFIMREGKYSVLEDAVQTTPAQFFTPRNIVNWKVKKSYLKLPHALRVQYINPALNYQQDEIQVYADGYNKDGSAGLTQATQFETFQLFGVTNVTQAHRLARYYLACGQLRPRMIMFETDVEHLRCHAGDVVRVVNDVSLIGNGQGYIKSIALDGSNNATSVTLDDTIYLTGGSYAAHIRRIDGSELLASINTYTGGNTTLTFQTPIPAATSPFPAVGDLVLVGSTSDLLVTKIEPISSPQFAARLTCVDYNPAVFNSDTTPVPTYTSNITIPYQYEQNRQPATPSIVTIRSDDTVMTRGADGTPIPQIVIDMRKGDANTDYFEARFQPYDSTLSLDNEFIYMPPVVAASGQIALTPVQVGLAYDIDIRATTKLGAASDWISYLNYTVQGKSTVPPVLASADISDSGILTWSIAGIQDIAGYEVRVIDGSTVNWAGGALVVQGLVTVNTLDVGSLVTSGTKTFMIKAVDTSGNYASTPVSVKINLGDPLLSNVVVTKDYWALGFPGTITGGSVSAGNLVAGTSGVQWTNDSALFWSGTDTNLMWTAGYTAVTYDDTFDVIASELPATLKLQYTIAGASWTIQYRKGTYGAFWNASDAVTFWNASDAVTFWPAPTWTDYLPWPGEVVAEAATYELLVTVAADPAIQGVVSGLKWLLDVVDVVERFSGLYVPSGGQRVPLTKTFRNIVTVHLTLQADGVGDKKAYYSDKVTTIGAGPLIQVTDVSGNPAAGFVDVIVQGY